MSLVNESTHESSKTIIELELKLFNLLEFTLFTIKTYLILICAKVYQIFKIDYFVNLVRILICNIKARLNNNDTQRRNLLEWIRTKVKGPHSPTNFNEDWKDGITLCALIEGVVHGSCPRFDLLNPEQSLDNIKLGLALIKKYLNIDSPIESHEIHDGSDEAKLVYFLSRIKFESIKMLMKSILTRSITKVKDLPENSHKIFESIFGDEKACFAKGMGLILGVRTRRARFNIFCKPTDKLNLMIEISGPNNSMCSEKITVHNQRRISTDILTSSLIADALNRRLSNEENLKIPFFYEIFANKIVVTYIPLLKGVHKLSIIWQGQHIMNSPYTVNVEDSGIESEKVSQVSNAYIPTKFLPGLQYPVNALGRRDSLCFNETATVVGRKVLKQVVMVNGKEKVIIDHNNDILAISNQLKQTSDNQYLSNTTQLDKKLNDCEISAKQSNLNCDNIQICPLSSDIESINNQRNLQTDLCDIIETNSIQPECASKALNDDKNNEHISYMDYNKPDSPKIESEKIDDSINDINKKIDDSINDINELEESSNILQKNKDSQNSNLYDKYLTNNDNKEDENVSTEQQIAIKRSSSITDKVINNSYYSNRSFLPVKNMIQNWETKLSKNNGDNNTKYIENANQNMTESRIRYNIPVKNRCKIFEDPKIDNLTAIEAENAYSFMRKEFGKYFSIDDKKQFWKDITCPQKDEKSNDSENIEKDELIEDKCNKSITPLNDMNQPFSKESIITDSEKSQKSSFENLSHKSVTKTPESHPDSGISTNIFCNLKNEMQNFNLSRQKSHSYPELNKLSNFCVKDCDSSENNKNDGMNTRTSSLVGQFIDDEIPDFSSLFLGEYMSYTGLINTDRPMTYDDLKFDDLAEEDYNSDTNREMTHNSISDIGIYPERCQVFGAGVYYGQVGIKNHFVVSTKECGQSFLAVGIQSAEQEDVVEVTVTSIGERNYEVLYEVSRPGYYIIFVKWGDYNVADSPFICKVTY